MSFKLSHKSPAVIIAAILAAAILPSTARVGTGDTPRKTIADSMTYNDSRRYDYFFIEAIRQQHAGHYTAAFDLLNHCIEINPDAAEAYYVLSMYHSELGNDSMALADIEKAAALNPDNDTYQERVAQYYIGAKDYDKAIEAYENLYENHRDRSYALNILTQLYRRKNDYTNMLRCIDRLEQIEGASDETALSKMGIYEMQGDKRNARKLLQSLVDTHPNDAIYKVMFGNWLLQNDNKKEAHKMFTDALDNDPDNESAQSSMYDYYRSVGQDSLAEQLRNRILMSSKTSSKTKTSMLQELIRENEKAGGDSTAVLETFDRVMAANRQDAGIATLKAAYMQLKKMPDDSVTNALAHVLEIAPDNASARLQLIQTLWPRKKWDEIISLCLPAVQYNPEEMAFYYFLGLAHFQKNDYDEALDAFKRGVGEINEQSDPNIVSDFYAIMGDILYEKDRPEEAFAAYDSCLQWKEDNISCLNNYAYYLSQTGRDLRKAEQMSYKTVEAEPNNATYLDTYAWILYMQERYDEAKTYIDMALDVDTDSMTSHVITEHAGDIYAANGDMGRAAEFWNKAIERGGDKAILQKKIRQKKFIKKTKKQ